LLTLLIEIASKVPSPEMRDIDMPRQVVPPREGPIAVPFVTLVRSFAGMAQFVFFEMAGSAEGRGARRVAAAIRFWTRRVFELGGWRS
jgi:hypothetical protein